MFQCELDDGTTAWVMLSFLLVLGMCPGLALFQAGLLPAKNTLSIITQIICGITMNSVLWVLFGYSLTFGEGKYIGNFHYALFRNISAIECSKHAPQIPALVFAVFQMMFAVITPLLLTGSYAERLRLKPFLIITVLWEILVYYPLAHWIFNTDGWLYKIGVRDFAGGIVIHTSAGVASLVIVYIIGRRQEFDEHHGESPPSNIPLAFVGTTFLWLGWFGFNAGSALSTSSGIAAIAVANTQISAVSCALVWLLIGVWRKSPNSVMMMNSTIAGLAGITPACGFIEPPLSLVVGFILGFVSYFSIILLKEKWHIDDALDVSSVHGVTGAVGAICIGFFSTKSINSENVNGLFYGGGLSLLGYQILGVIVASVYAAFITFIILKFISFLGIQIRCTEESEESGLDMIELGETAYHELFHIDTEELKNLLPKHFRSSQRRLLRSSPKADWSTVKLNLSNIVDMKDELQRESNYGTNIDNGVTLSSNTQHI